MEIHNDDIRECRINEPKPARTIVVTMGDLKWLLDLPSSATISRIYIDTYTKTVVMEIELAIGGANEIRD